MSLDEIIAHRTAMLTAYQNDKLAQRYRALVDQVRAAAESGGYGDALPRAVAINYAKLLAYKDEYEVARLLTDPSFEQSIHDRFEGEFKVNFHLAPPSLPGIDASGRPKKRQFGEHMRPLFRTLAKLRFLRGTPLDLFGYHPERKLERDLIAGYEKDVATVLEHAVAADARHRGGNPVAAGHDPRLWPDQGEVGAGRQGALRRIGATARRSRADSGAASGGVVLPFPSPQGGGITRMSRHMEFRPLAKPRGMGDKIRR